MVSDAQLAQLSGICLSLPEASRENNGKHATFSIRKKTFVYYLNDHHGDGIIAACVKALPGDNLLLAQADPARFFLPAYIGARGWVALRLDVGEIDWEEVRQMVVYSYLRTAPKRLCAIVQGSALRIEMGG